MSTSNVNSFSLLDLVSAVNHIKQPVFFYLNKQDGLLLTIKDIISALNGDLIHDIGVVSCDDLGGQKVTRFDFLLKLIDEQYHHLTQDEMIFLNAWLNFRTHHYAGKYQRFNFEAFKDMNLSLANNVDFFTFEAFDCDSDFLNGIRKLQDQYENGTYEGLANPRFNNI